MMSFKEKDRELTMIKKLNSATFPCVAKIFNCYSELCRVQDNDLDGVFLFVLFCLNQLDIALTNGRKLLLLILVRHTE